MQLWKIFLQLAPILRGATTAVVNSNKRPNVVFIMTDDQDLELNSLAYMPLLDQYITKKGTSFNKHYCTIAICCPSRVSLWTGKSAHNTNVTDVVPPYGGYTKFIAEGLNNNHLPVWLQAAGYNTFYTGKLFNGQSTTTYNQPFVQGFTSSDFLIDPGTYRYLNATMVRDHGQPITYPGLYNTDLIANKTYGYIDEAAAAGQPFFLVSAPIAPHTETILQSGKPVFLPPTPAERHKDLFQDVKVPRVPSFNPAQPKDVSWLAELAPLNGTVVDYLDEFYRLRLRSLQAVDEMVEGVIKRLDAHGLLDNTYVIYTSDNGFHMGHYRMQPGKSCGYEMDVHLPLIIRGPGIAQGSSVDDLVTTHTDLAPLIMELVGEKPRSDFDGLSFPVTASGLKMMPSKSRHEHINIEYWGGQLIEGKYVDTLPATGTNNTYKSIRLVGDKHNYYYSVWCDGSHELYDMNADPHQMSNLLADGVNSTQLNGRPLAAVQDRLDALALVLKTCKGDVCVQPWKSLHPRCEVNDFEDAMDSKYDAFYTELPKVKFDMCLAGYFTKNEQPMFESAWAYGGR